MLRYSPHLITGLSLLGLSIFIMARPGLPERGRDFLLVLFACIALLPDVARRRGV